MWWQGRAVESKEVVGSSWAGVNFLLALPANRSEPFRGSSRLGPGAGTKESGDLNSGP